MGPSTTAPSRPDGHAWRMREAGETYMSHGVHSLEVRWILPGPLDAAVAGWFGRFPAEMESREDSYLVDPDLRGVSVKVRGGRAVEVKVYHGGAGMLEVPGCARGCLQSWQKWSIPVGRLSPDGAELAGWTVIRKRRRISRLRLDNGRIVETGNHEQLIQAGGIYRRLYELSFKPRKEEKD